MDVGREHGPTVRASGVVPWRREDGRLEVALVHRPKYDDWSWPKGKLEPGESWAAAAVREMLEETGLHARLGIPLPHAAYEVGAVDAHGGTRPKHVRYWAAQVVAGDGSLAHEVDDVSWLEPAAARRRLSYRRDRDQLDAVVAADGRGSLATWPLAVVRHATAVPRRRWKGDDGLRPLDEAGDQRARDLVPLLSAYGLRRVVSSTSTRCSATLEPYARAAGYKLHVRRSLSEEGHADDPGRSALTLAKVLERGEPAVLCSHRPVLPALVGELADRATDALVARALRESQGPGFVKGEVLVAHVVGRADDASVVSVERHDTR